MPGWPTVGRTDDQQLVEALRRADATAPAKLYDSYAERLNDYAHSLLGDRDGAAEAVHDALVTACGCVDRLREPSRLRPWLYALVRLRCAAGARAAAPEPEFDDHDVPDDRELAVLVHEALAELSGQEREALELSLRHDLSTGEVGMVLGLSSRQATTRLGRAREHLENSAAAVVLARVGRAHCPDLSAMVDSWEGPLTTMLRRRLSGHIARCEVCLERRSRHVSAGRLLDMVPAAFPPLSLRRRVIETCVNPDFAVTRAVVTEAGDRFDRTGFPVAAERRAKTRGRTGPRGTRAKRTRRRGSARRTAPVIVAALCVLVVTGVVIVFSGREVAGGSADPADAAPNRKPALITLEPAPEAGSPEPSPPEPTPEPVESTESAEPTRTSEPGRTRTAAPTPGPARPAATRRPVPDRPRVTRGPAARPATGRLAVSCPTDIGEGAGQIQLSARNAAVSWSATASGGLDVRPRRGRLRAGATSTIWVSAADPDESGTGRVAFTSAGGASSCAISWEGLEAEASDPPSDPPPLPTSAPTPSPTASAE
ncbi:RNA polymerase sigma factor [Streptosporangium sp. CA-135522]|uniref:RNA polymerase sigma factor n=1 Tax=Streptosporangium sp. CA-135522 TaxID=3240072 RepID=UPI003D8DCDB9